MSAFNKTCDGFCPRMPKWTGGGGGLCPWDIMSYTREIALLFNFSNFKALVKAPPYEAKFFCRIPAKRIFTRLFHGSEVRHKLAEWFQRRF